MQSVAPASLDDTKGIIQIVHGMAEHTDRYLEVAGFLCDAGYAVIMHDHAGHGRSVKTDADDGYFADKDGWLKLVDDVYEVTKLAKETFPGKKLIIWGHSMGSFITRKFIATYKDAADAAILCGTAGANPAAGVGIGLANLVCKLKGPKAKSTFINNIAFGSYNKRFEGRTDFDWLTRDREIVDRYIADPYCGYLFTVQGMEDLIRANAASNAKDWYEKVPKNLPVLLVSGEEDPVGDYGSGVKNVADRLKATGHTRVTVKLYPGCRHEVLNETNRQEVMDDLLAWMGTVPETR